MVMARSYFDPIFENGRGAGAAPAARWASSARRARRGASGGAAAPCTAGGGVRQRLRPLGLGSRQRGIARRAAVSANTRSRGKIRRLRRLLSSPAAAVTREHGHTTTESPQRCARRALQRRAHGRSSQRDRGSPKNNEALSVRVSRRRERNQRRGLGRRRRRRLRRDRRVRGVARRGAETERLRVRGQDRQRGRLHRLGRQRGAHGATERGAEAQGGADGADGRAGPGRPF
mmetsp:Transcript_13558/g.40580  ORF Transcript_13558/g.40580 Transcript_13558/m.40580 type:complete len:231 (+) Transcript_13558:805-1497(+)